MCKAVARRVSLVGVGVAVTWHTVNRHQKFSSVPHCLTRIKCRYMYWKWYPSLWKEPYSQSRANCHFNSMDSLSSCSLVVWNAFQYTATLFVSFTYTNTYTYVHLYVLLFSRSWVPRLTTSARGRSSHSTITAPRNGRTTLGSISMAFSVVCYGYYLLCCRFSYGYIHFMQRART